MIQVCPLASGSNGNSFYIGDEVAGVLVDAGISNKAILAGLDFHGLRPQQVKAVLITHEHSDHIKGLKVFLKKQDVPVYGSEPCLAHLQKNELVPRDTLLTSIADNKQLRQVLLRTTPTTEIAITPFKVPHDVPLCIGFRIKIGDRVIGYATDIGMLTDEVWGGLQGCDLAVIESNYEPRLLAMTPAYPPYLKERIRGEFGHMSNQDCAQLATKLALTGTGRFILAHISQNSNMPELALQAAIASLSANGLQQDQHYQLIAAKRSRPTPAVFL